MPRARSTDGGGARAREREAKQGECAGGSIVVLEACLTDEATRVTAAAAQAHGGRRSLIISPMHVRRDHSDAPPNLPSSVCELCLCAVCAYCYITWLACSVCALVSPLFGALRLALARALLDALGLGRSGSGRGACRRASADGVGSRRRSWRAPRSTTRKERKKRPDALRLRLRLPAL